MDILGIGPMELFFVIMIALIIMGPKDMQKTGKTLGKWLNRFVRSDSWKIVKQTSNKIKYLPNELMREAGIDELKNVSREINSDLKKEVISDFEDPFKDWKKQKPDLKSILPHQVDEKQTDLGKLEKENIPSDENH